MESEQLFTKDYFDSLQRGFKKDSQEDLSESQKEDEIYS